MMFIKNFLKRRKFKVVKVEQIKWYEGSHDNKTHTVTLVFLENGYGKRRVDVHNTLPFLYKHKDHKYWHNYVIPWLVGVGSVSKKNNVVKLRSVKG